MNEETKKKIIVWIFENHAHHDSPTSDCKDADSPYVNSLDLQKFIESL